MLFLLASFTDDISSGGCIALIGKGFKVALFIITNVPLLVSFFTLNKRKESL